MVLFFGLAASAQAATYYVDSSITDTNVGSATPDFTTYNPTTFATTGGSDSVYKTIADVNLKSFSAGDNIYFRKGQTWRETLTIPSSGSSGNVITYSNFASGALPIISGANIQGSFSDLGSNVWSSSLTTDPKFIFFDGVQGTLVANQAAVNSDKKWWWGTNVLYVYSVGDPSTTYTNPGIEVPTRTRGITVNRSYITIDGLQVEKPTQNGIINFPGDTTQWTDITIQNSTIRQSGQANLYFGSTVGRKVPNNLNVNHNTIAYGTRGTTAFSADGIFVQPDDTTGGQNQYYGYNTVYSDRVGPNSNGNRQGIWVRAGTATIEHNEIYGVDHGIHIDGTATGTGGNATNWIIRYNWVHDTADDAIWLNYGNSASGLVSYNLCYNNSDNFFDIANATNAGTIANNTCVTSLNGAIEIVGTAAAIFKNNIFYDYNTNNAYGHAAITAHDGGDATASTYVNNLYYSAATSNITYTGATAYNLANWRTLSSQDANSLNSDPLFTNTAGNDFTLQSTSPAINAGVDLGATYDDAILPGSSWPSSVTTADQDLRGSGWEIGAYVYPVPRAPTISTPSAQSVSSIRWNFTDNASDETGFRVYDNLGAIATSSATVDLSYLDEIGLTCGTSYSGRYVKAYNSYGESTASAVASSQSTSSCPGGSSRRHTVSFSSGGALMDIGTSTAQLSWQTNNQAKWTLSWWKEGMLGEEKKEENRTYSKEHQYTISDLKPETTYSYSIQLIGEGGENSYLRGSFTTLPPAPLNSDNSEDKLTQRIQSIQKQIISLLIQIIGMYQERLGLH